MTYREMAARLYAMGVRAATMGGAILRARVPTEDFPLFHKRQVNDISPASRGDRRIVRHNRPGKGWE